MSKGAGAGATGGTVGVFMFVIAACAGYPNWNVVDADVAISAAVAGKYAGLT